MNIQMVDQRHYDLDLMQLNSLVFDLGALHGRFSEALARSGHRVIAFEADPEGVKTIPTNPKVTIVPKAIGFPTGSRQFHQYLPCDGANGFYQNESEKAISPGRMIEVDVITLEDAVRFYGIPDLLKMNVEGAEIEIIENTPDDILSNIKQITVSFHTFCQVITEEQAEKSRQRLRDLGFDLTFFKEFPDECWAVRK